MVPSSLDTREGRSGGGGGRRKRGGGWGLAYDRCFTNSNVIGLHVACCFWSVFWTFGGLEFEF